MSLRQKYYGQQDGSTAPDVALTGNPGTDQITLTNAGYLGGAVMALFTSATAGRGQVIGPCDASAGQVPFGFLINGPGEFAGSIGPSGSGKAPILRGLPQFYVDSQAYDATATFTVGLPVYAGGGSKKGLITATAATGTGAYTAAIGVCTQSPTTQNPWLGVASYL
jgi:hypothetical protein